MKYLHSDKNFGRFTFLFRVISNYTPFPEKKMRAPTQTDSSTDLQHPFFPHISVYETTIMKAI